ncbi:MAG: formate dehydrogenase accessory protein FdhE [Geobacteraceae bacterium]|nr:formate dehydrogenase accessory protein FdhE [Geobacteraceae bacterium]
MNIETRILEPGQIEAPAGQIRFLILPGHNLFKSRAERFRHLSPGHPLGEYLAFLALLADAQQKALNTFPVLALPDADEQAICREHGMPLLAARSWSRDPVWRDGLTTILQQMRDAVLPPTAQETIAGLQLVNVSGLEEMADRILAEDLAGISPQELPFVAAALQVYWVRMAAGLGEGAFGRLEQGGVCPVCGSLPHAGIVFNSGAEQGLRYLCCSLCASQWHMVRIKCSSCESTHGINHYTLEGSDSAVKAESCDDCDTYLKLLYLEKDRQMETMADDLATLALDMLMDNEGKSRGGPNLFYHPGAAL